MCQIFLYIYKALGLVLGGYFLAQIQSPVEKKKKRPRFSALTFYYLFNQKTFYISVDDYTLSV